jgi:hypothetical protein
VDNFLDRSMRANYDNCTIVWRIVLVLKKFVGPGKRKNERI